MGNPESDRRNRVRLVETLAELDIPSSQVVLFHSNQAARRTFNILWREMATTPPPLNLEYPVGLALHVIHQQKKLDAATQ